MQLILLSLSLLYLVQKNMVQFFSNLLEFYDFFCTGLANCKDVSVDITKHFFLCIIAFSSYKPSFAKLSLSPNEAGLSKLHI